MDRYRISPHTDGEASTAGTSGTSATVNANATIREKFSRITLRRGLGNPFVQSGRRQTLGSIISYWIKHIYVDVLTIFIVGMITLYVRSSNTYQITFLPQCFI